MRLLGDIHVIPRDDEEPRVVIHNALDGREGYENGRRKLH